MDSSSPASEGSRGVAFSDEEVRLAVRHPKKRAGRKKFRETRHPVYCRVRRRDSDKWVREGFVEWKNDERVSDES